jgi:hypothetical protein
LVATPDAWKISLMPSNPIPSLVALALLSPLAPAFRSQDPKPPAPAAEAPVAKPKEAVGERLTAWPKLAPKDKDQVTLDIERLVKQRTPEMGVQAHAGLVGAGDAAVPMLLDRYGREKDEDALKRLREVLIEATHAEQTRLLAKEFDGKLPLTRTFVLWRVAAFPDPEVRPAAEASWARIQKLADKADPDERYAAALCCASTGSTAGLDALYEAAQKRWDKHGVEIRAALEGCRGPEACALALEKLNQADQQKDRKLKVAALRLLAGCGEKSAAKRVRWFLDEEDNAVRIAAINALRGIVDGAPPEEQLSAFEAIETAKKWKDRV